MDGNGHLSLEEMLEGYDHNPEFRGLMQQMDCGILRVCFSCEGNCDFWSMAW